MNIKIELVTLAWLTTGRPSLPRGSFAGNCAHVYHDPALLCSLARARFARHNARSRINCVRPGRREYRCKIRRPLHCRPAVPYAHPSISPVDRSTSPRTLPFVAPRPNLRTKPSFTRASALYTRWAERTKSVVRIIRSRKYTRSTWRKLTTLCVCVCAHLFSKKHQLVRVNEDFVTRMKFHRYLHRNEKTKLIDG